MSDRITEHPSFGQVQFTRITGGHSRLYGSSIRKHGSSIMLTIRRSEPQYDLGRSWFFGREALIEVELSAAQFAELLTTMNIGSGVPCTIKTMWVDGRYEQIKPPPDDEPLEHERVAQEFANDGKYARSINGALDDAQATVDAMLAGKSLRKADLKTVQAKLRKARQEVTANLPFMLGQFREAAEKVKTTVMAEADAWLTSVVQRAGLTALAGQAPSLEIDGPSSDENEEPVSDTSDTKTQTQGWVDLIMDKDSD